MWTVLAQNSDELLRSAKLHHWRGIILLQTACLIVALILFYAAHATLRKGFKVSESKTLTGGSARLVATAIALGGIAIVVFALFILPGMTF